MAFTGRCFRYRLDPRSLTDIALLVDACAALLSIKTFTAVKPDYLDVTVPAIALPGPVAIRVWRTTGVLAKVVFDLRYGNELFTVLPA